MTAPLVYVAVEGRIDESVAIRLVGGAGGQPHVVGRRAGKSWIAGNIARYNEAAQRSPWLVLRDLDMDAPCAPELVRNLLPVRVKGMTFRVPVRTVESWLLADAQALASSFGLNTASMPAVPDDLDDPKQAMVHLLAGSRTRQVRQTMVREERHGTWKPGPLYSADLAQFVTRIWDPDRASQLSPSLRRSWERVRSVVRA